MDKKKTDFIGYYFDILMEFILGIAIAFGMARTTPYSLSGWGGGL